MHTFFSKLILGLSAIFLSITSIFLIYRLAAILVRLRYLKVKFDDLLFILLAAAVISCSYLVGDFLY